VVVVVVVDVTGVGGAVGALYGRRNCGGGVGTGYLKPLGATDFGGPTNMSFSLANGTVFWGDGGANLGTKMVGCCW